VWEEVRNQFQHEKKNAEQSKKIDVAELRNSQMDFLQEYSHSTPHSVWEKVRNQFQHEKKMQSNQKKMMLQNT